jgi:uncharacterized protein (DUF1778 family)
MRSLTEYIVRLIEADANQVIREHSSLVLQNDAFDRFMDACEAAPPPNANLREALEFSKRPGSW